MTLAPGHYKARAVEGDFGVAGTGTKQVAVLFQIADGESQGEHITWYGYFTPSTSERTIESLRHCGCTFPGDDLTNLDGLTSNEVGLVLEEDVDQHGQPKVDEDGNPLVRVRWVNRGAGVALGTRMTAADKKAFAAEMRGYVLGSKPRGGDTTGPSTQRAPTSPTSPTGGANGTKPTSGRRGSMNDDIPY